MLLIAVMACTPAAAGSIKYDDLILFGDSLTDTGNSYLATITETPPSPDPTYYPNIGHYTDGATYGERMWQALQLPGNLAPSFVGGTNYAIGGARSRYGSAQMTDAGGLRLPPPVGTPDPDDPPIGSYLRQIDDYFGDTGGVADPDALYVVWMGGNDARDAATLFFAPDPTLPDPLDLVAQSVGDVTNGIVELIAAGARNFLVPTVSDIGLTPEAQSLGAAAAAVLSSWAQAYNDALDAALDLALDAIVGIDDLDLWQVDTFDRLGEVLDNPGRFGLTNVTDPCLSGYFVNAPTGGDIELCSNPAEYAFYDAVHPTSTVHAILAEDFLVAVPVPGSLPLLAGGLLLVGLRRFRAEGCDRRRRTAS
jgi:phospholipase/lecithinase/hemolysin